MDKLFISFKSLLNKIYLFYKKRNIVLKFLFFTLSIILIWASLPFIYNYIIYPLPDENGIKLEGRSATTIKDQRLYFLKYVSRDECEENKINNIYSLEKIGDINCTRVYPLSNLQTDEIPSTALLDYDVVVFSKLENDNYNIYRWQDGKISLIKSIPIFDLEDFRIKLASGAMTIADINIIYTGRIYQVKFKVIDKNTIGFLDAYVTKIENKIPTEVTVRERRLNIFTGEETIREREIERLDNERYQNSLVKNTNMYPDRKLDWSYYINNIIIANYISYTLVGIDQSKNVFILNTGKIERESFDIYDCKYYSYWITMPCLGVYYESIIFKREDALDSTILSRYAAPGMGAQILSDNERYLVFYLDRADLFWRDTDKTLIFNYLYDVDTKRRTLLGKGYRFINLR